jgi:hypothetical protein
MEEKQEFYYYRVNTRYPVGIRFNMGDTKGKVLTLNDPYVAVRYNELRDFRRANYFAIDKGLIIATEEPSMDIESPNMIDDAKAAALVKNKIALKDALANITSAPVVAKLLDEAKLQGRNSGIIKMIETKMKEFEIVEDEDSPLVMRGVENN